MRHNGKVRLCVDFRQLNRYCRREIYTSPSVLETIQEINSDDGKIFSMFDAWKGYHQIELDEASKNFTTFITPFGRYRYERAPYGINSFSEHYNRRMTEELSGLRNLKKVVDDNLIYSRANMNEHMSLVRAFLQRCRERGIRLNRAKCTFAQSRIDFAGVTLDGNGYRIQEKISERHSGI